MPGAAASSWGFSTTTASVVRSRHRDGRGVLERGAHHLGGIDDASLHQVFVDLGLGVVAKRALTVPDLGNDDGAFGPGVFHDLANRSLQGPTQNVDTDLLVVILHFEVGKLLLGADQGHATAGNDPLFHGRAGRVEGVLDESLLLLHRGLGRRADVDHGDSTGELRQPFLELLTIVVRGGLLDGDFDLLDATLDLVLLTGAVDERGVVLVDDHTLGRPEVTHHRILELEAHLLGDDLATHQDRDVLKHGLSPIAEPGGLHGAHLQGAAELVHHQGRQRLALDVLSEDKKGLTHLGDLLEDGEEVLHGRDLLVVHENHGIFKNSLHPLRIGHEVRREVAAIELHALDGLQSGLEAAGLLDRDDAVLADLLHGVGDEVADLGVAVGRDRADLGDLLLALGVLGEALKHLHDPVDGLVDAAADPHGVRAGGDVLQALAEDGLGEKRGGRGAVTGHVGGLRGDFLDHLGAHVLYGVFQLHFLGHGHAVLGDRRGTELTVDNDVPALGTQRDPHGLGQLVDTCLQASTRVDVKTELFSSHCLPTPVCLYRKLPNPRRFQRSTPLPPGCRIRVG